jgi:hypothetical protein
MAGKSLSVVSVSRQCLPVRLLQVVLLWPTGHRQCGRRTRTRKFEELHTRDHEFARVDRIWESDRYGAGAPADDYAGRRAERAEFGGR